MYRFSFICAPVDKNTAEASNNNLTSELSRDITLLIKEIDEFMQANREVLYIIKPDLSKVSVDKNLLRVPYLQDISEMTDCLCSSSEKETNTMKLLKFYHSYFNGEHEKEEKIKERTLKIRFQNILLVPYILDKLACCFKKVTVFVPMSYYVCREIFFYITVADGVAETEYLKNFDTIWRPVNLSKFVNFITVFLTFVLEILKKGYNFAYTEAPYRVFPILTTAADHTVLIKYMKCIQEQK
jgi:hypothetical protein